MEEFQKACCIRGYHVYKDIWEAVANEELVCVMMPLSLVAFRTSLLARAITFGGRH